MAIEKNYGKFYPICDGCGEELHVCETFEEAVDTMKEADWNKKFLGNYPNDGEWVNLCPTCQEDY